MGGHERLNNYETMIFGFRKHPSVDQPSELQRIILRGIIFETSVKIVGTKERFSPPPPPIKPMMKRSGCAI